mmetsp:Transcript_82097/g.135702  ORF Transcript_82097/g.135702 Transcript_82097/m.135702 type:complete len:206 (-) Transcript_82097:36-653(-)
MNALARRKACPARLRASADSLRKAIKSSSFTLLAVLLKLSPMYRSSSDANAHSEGGIGVKYTKSPAKLRISLRGTNCVSSTPASSNSSVMPCHCITIKASAAFRSARAPLVRDSTENFCLITTSLTLGTKQALAASSSSAATQSSRPKPCSRPSATDVGLLRSKVDVLPASDDDELMPELLMLLKFGRGTIVAGRMDAPMEYVDE